MRRNRVPGVVVRRLATYYRVLKDINAAPESYISSQELAELAGVNSAQVRKDLALFGEFGKQGVGYPVLALKAELGRILGDDREMGIAIFGVGELGTALTRYLVGRKQADPGYKFVVKALFDVDPAKIGTDLEGVTIRSLSDLPVFPPGWLQIAVITVPAQAAQEVVDLAVSRGIKGFLNFAPVRLRVPPGVRVQYFDVTLELHELAFFMTML